MIGSLDWESDAEPRIRILPLEPVSPAPGRPTTPGSRPCSTSLKLVIGLSSRRDTSTVAIELPSRFFSVATPVPVTTIWSSAIAVTVRPKSAVEVSPAPTVTVCEPAL